MTASPPDAPREIERKYLLSRLPPSLEGSGFATLRQGYLPGVEIHERVREERDDAGVRHTRTVKLGRGVSRLEFEETIDATFFAGLYVLTEGARVEKRRYRVAAGDRTWEVDDFTDRALVLAEIELADASEAVTFPGWLAPYVVREVTDEPAYLNLRLAR